MTKAQDYLNGYKDGVQEGVKLGMKNAIELLKGGSEVANCPETTDNQSKNTTCHLFARQKEKRKGDSQRKEKELIYSTLYNQPYSNSISRLYPLPSTLEPLPSTLEPLHRVYKDQFDVFWDAFPKRGGRKRFKKDSWEKFRRLESEDLPQVMIAVQNYANSEEARQGFACDPHRWLIKDRWRAYLEKADLHPSEDPNLVVTGLCERCGGNMPVYKDRLDRRFCDDCEVLDSEDDTRGTFEDVSGAPGRGREGDGNNTPGSEQTERRAVASPDGTTPAVRSQDV